MQMRKAKFILLALLAVFTLFFSNDFGLIDVEKTSIITAIAIDKEQDDYLITAQIAVPEATDANTENKKAEIVGRGKTVGEALKNLGNVSGWFPKLAFCNLIILGNSLSQTNVVKVLDYFAKTLRIQDSALVALAEKDAKELLSLSTPLDNISSFALQKIMLKNPGFDRDVCASDIKTFCAGHYSPSGSAFMPLVKVVSSKSGNQDSESDSSGTSSNSSNSMQSGSSSAGTSGGQSQGGNSNNNLFDARTTALFKDGFKVGELSPELTVTLNSFFASLDDTTLSVENVPYMDKTCNFLLNVESSSPCIKIFADDNRLKIEFSLSIFCKISDVNTDSSDQALSENKPLPYALKTKAEQMLSERITTLIETSQRTGCDIFRIKEKLYRYHNKQYSRYKDNYLSVMDFSVKTEVNSQL